MCAPVCQGARENSEGAGRKEARAGDEEVERRRVEEEEQKAWKEGY